MSLAAAKGTQQEDSKMGLIRPAGKSATEIRKGTLHGSTAKRRMAKWGGQLQRLGEKPKGGGKK
jgi:hypothetical protein